MSYAKTYSPCDDCPHIFSKNNQESNVCKICEFNRQQAEIERLKNSGIRANSVEDWLKHCNELRAEAYEEFAEAYKDQVKNYTGMFTDDGFYVSLNAILSAVDFVYEKFLKEMGCSGES